MMARSAVSVRRALLLCTLALFATTAIAQDQSSTDGRGTTTNPASSPPSASSTNAGPTSTPPSSAGSSTSAASSRSISSATSLPNLGDATKSTASSTSSSRATSSRASLPPTGTSVSGPPRLSTSNAAGGTFSYPAPTVPPTSNAPFMQHSTLPQGTVFIAVGAILGAFGLAVLLWRVVVACLLHRSVKRAALAQHLANDKSGFPGVAPPVYKFSDRTASVASIGALTDATASRGVRRTNRGPTPSATPSQTNLFFSPTAPNASGLNSVGNRSSAFLPSGFYAAGAGAASQGHGHSISLTNLRPESRGHGVSNLRPDSRGHSRLGHTPPDSPAMGPRQDLGRRNYSTSSLNVAQAGRTPSTYLEDLLDDTNGPLPPPGHSGTWGPSRH